MLDIKVRREKLTSLFVWNLDSRVNEDLLYELFAQVAHVQRVNIPTDPLTGLQKQYGFVDVGTKEMADYCKAVLSGVELYGKQLSVQDSRADVGQGVFTQQVLRVAFTKPPNYIDDCASSDIPGKESPSRFLEKLKDILGRFGVVTGQVCHDGYALYSFSNDSAVKEAANALNNQFICGMLITTTIVNR
ncbi:Splicing factor 3B subunit, putative [Giardia duodenalis ATCC 50581]|nr:Splicing factor 3B subunit, putative [Giardia intestinalis ATCC 50581]